MRVAIDSSAWVCSLLPEPESALYERALTRAAGSVMSAMSVFETRLVLVSKGGALVLDRFERLLQRLEIRIAAFDAGASLDAFAAHRRFGRGTGHSSRLNMGDCAAYALARSTGLPLLFKGDDFEKTDVTPALPLLLAKAGGGA